jgi:hypothetical protein
VTTSSVSPYLQRPVRKLEDVISELTPLESEPAAEAGTADSEAAAPATGPSTRERAGPPR